MDFRPFTPEQMCRLAWYSDRVWSGEGLERAEWPLEISLSPSPRSCTLYRSLHSDHVAMMMPELELN